MNNIYDIINRSKLCWSVGSSKNSVDCNAIHNKYQRSVWYEKKTSSVKDLQSIKFCTAGMIMFLKQS